jgi:outer membrane protein assembly factor BamB
MGLLMGSRAISILAFAVGLVMAGCAGLRIDRVLKPSDRDWVMYGGTVDRANNARGSVQPPLEEVWQYNSQGGILGSPIVRDSVIILGTLSGELQAVNFADGKRLGYKIMGSAIVGTPVLDGGQVIVTLSGKTETLLSYDLREGRRNWSFPAGPVETSPLVIGNNIYVATLAGVMHCVDKRTGEQLWKFETAAEEEREPVRSSPAADGTVVTFGTDAGMLFGVDQSNGVLRWKVETGASIFATPVIISGVVVVGNLNGTVHGVDAQTGNVLWKVETGSKVYGAASASQAGVFVGTSDGVLHALDVRSGKELWSFSAKSVINSAPLVAGSVLFLGAMDRTLYCLDVGTGRELWRFAAEGRIKVTPVLWGDILLVTSEDKYITALRPQESR